MISFYPVIKKQKPERECGLPKVTQHAGVRVPVIVAAFRHTRPDQQVPFTGRVTLSPLVGSAVTIRVYPRKGAYKLH